MGHKNYSKYSENLKESNNEELIEKSSITSGYAEISEEVVTTEEQIMTTTVDVVEEKNEYIVKGTVVECDKLNVRKEPSKDADILCVINKGDEVQVNLKIEGEPKIGDVSFYQVYTASGVEGYCMTKYISIE